ncbi:tetraacyldisaccharide 4'-kinase, partial [Flavobacteriaceae bacterium]|nr:tetraacyldisaccharide 4'-kinase [Flavobacteriaceae bacterium]
MNKLKFLLFPLSIFYLIITNIRNSLYDLDIFKSHSFNVPLVGVGNISSGGTGKTPFVEYLLKKYSKTFKTVLISRGYKRSSKGFQKANRSSSPLSIGDEPYQIFKKFKNIQVAVDKNRVNAVSKILNDHPDTNLVLLDDSFQHRKIRPKLNILLTTYSNPFFNDCILPVGSLRESKSSYQRADIVIVTKCPEKIDKTK